MACSKLVETPRHQYNPEYNNKGNPKILYKRCIGNYYDGFWASMVNYYPRFESGVSSFDGGFLDQPAKFVEVMQLVHNLIRENEKEQERAKKLSKRN